MTNEQLVSLVRAELLARGYNIPSGKWENTAIGEFLIMGKYGQSQDPNADDKQMLEVLWVLVNEPRGIEEFFEPLQVPSGRSSAS